MEDRTYQKVAGVVGVLLILGVAVYGTYLPMRKSQIFITTLQSLQRNPVANIDDLKQRLSVALDYPAPIGQEELVRNMANSVLNFVQQSPDASATDAVIGFLNTYFDPIIASGKGMSFGQDLYIGGAVNEIAFVKTGEKHYLDSALADYKEAAVLGPNRPQALYGLFDIYRATSDATNTLAIGAKILSNWPGDQRIIDGIAPFLAKPTKK